MPVKHSLLASLSVFALLITSFASAPAAEKDLPADVNKAFNNLIARNQDNNPSATRWTISQRLEFHGVAGTGIAIIRDGEVFWEGGFGVRQAGTNDAIDQDTVFSAGSVSKIINAALVLRLVAEGKLDLDTHISRYMVRWKIPPSRYDDTPVTLRQILSHTGGFNIHGFADFQPGDPLPTLLDTLNGQYPARHGHIRLIHRPGTEMDYSGGGIQVSQLIVEDATGLSYEAAARRYVFEPLAMSRSTFKNPLPVNHGNIARAHGNQGNPVALPRGYEAMPEQAASGLWVSAADLAKLVIALMGRGDNANFLPGELINDMMTREKNSWHGLGPRINGHGRSLVFHHGGANDSYRAWIQGHPHTGDGLVVLTNGTNGNDFYYEVRMAIEDSLGWDIRTDTSFSRPKL